MPREPRLFARQGDGHLFRVPGPEQETYSLGQASGRWRLPPEMIAKWCRDELVPGARIDEDSGRWALPGAVVEGHRPHPQDLRFSDGLDYLRHLDGPVELSDGATWTLDDLPEGVELAEAAA